MTPCKRYHSTNFWQGYLLANHLHKDDLLDVSMYLHYHCVLTSRDEPQLGQVILWREVYRRPQTDVVPGYSQPLARHVMLVVGMVRVHRSCVLIHVHCNTF